MKRETTTSPKPGLRAGCVCAHLTLTAVATTGCDTGINNRSVILPAAFDRTGTLRSDGAYEAMTDSGLVSVGDNGSLGGDGSTSNRELRGFVSVTLSAIPDGVDVTEVVLQIAGSASAGNAFGDFGQLYIDHVNIVSGINLDSFSSGGLSSGFATIASLPMTGPAEIVEIDVTEQVKADITAGRPISSFRFRFNGAPSADLQHDVAAFDAFPDVLDQQPFATATYQP